MHINLIWFRNDLRICDNPALYFSCKNSVSETTLALFISTPKQWIDHCMAPKKAFLIYKNVILLQKKITELGIEFYYHESTDYLESINYIVNFCIMHRVNSIFFNYEYEFFERKRDELVKKELKKHNIIVNCFHDSVLIHPGFIKNKQGKMYKKYSYFKNECIKEFKKCIPSCFPKPKKYIKNGNSILWMSIPVFKISVENFDTNLFPVGEDQVLQKLEYFFKNKFNTYNINRNLLELDVTSMLSAHLSIGVISSRQCINLLINNFPNIINSLEQCLWINELLWREFYRHLLYFYPELGQNKSFCLWENNIKWNNNINHFDLWKQGKTGYPIIDAGMRQLNKLGWLSNRLRMLTASFLVKNLLIDWKKGEKYFMSQLIDGDFASNNGNWQWISSLGTDSVPYFRIFNPMLQSRKIDKNAKFIHRYIPELQIFPLNKIHNPLLFSKNNNSYPNPIVNYYHSKQKALLVFKNAKYKKNNINC